MYPLSISDTVTLFGGNYVKFMDINYYLMVMLIDNCFRPKNMLLD